MAFSNDGKKMFVIGNGTGGSINEYTLSDPFDLSTASFANVNFSVSPQDMNPTGMAFSNDSTTMFVVGLNKSDVNEYTLSAPFGISTATFVDAFSVSSQESSPTGMAFSNDGAKMFVIGDAGDDVNEYALLAPFDISTAAFVDAFSVSSRESSPTGMAFSSDGTKMFVIGDGAGGEGNINEYALTSIYPIDVVSEVGGNPASLASVTSSTADGAYGPGTVIDVQISFDEPVSLRTFPIQDSHPRVDLDAGRGAQIMHADGRHYAVVADRGDDSVRIIDISDPDRPDIVSEVHDTDDGFALDGSAELDIALIGERQYVMVGTDEYEASGLQLIDVTDPLNPTAGGAVQGLKGDEFNLIDVVTGVSAMQIGDHHYALVASVNVNGTTGSIVIVNITDPDNLSHVWSERADLGILAGYHHAFDIFPVHIDGHPYAAASFNDISGSRSSILILNMTDPGSPTLASSSLHWSREAAVTEVDGHHYVLTGRYPDNGLAIFNITDPSAPYSVANVTYRFSNDFSSITATEIDGTHYAVTVTSRHIVVTDITDPAHPSVVSTIPITTGRDPLGSPLRIYDGAVKILGRHYVPAIGNDKDYFMMLDITDPTQITEGRGGDPPNSMCLTIHSIVTTIEIRATSRTRWSPQRMITACR